MKKQKLFSLLSLAILFSPYLSAPTTLADVVDEQQTSEEIVTPNIEVEQPNETATEDITEETISSSENIPEEIIPDTSQTSEETLPETSTSDSQVPEESTSESSNETSDSNSHTVPSETQSSQSQVPEESTSDSSTSVEKEPETSVSKPSTKPQPNKKPSISTDKPVEVTPNVPVQDEWKNLDETSYSAITRSKDFDFSGFLGDFDASKFNFSKDVLKWQPLVESEAKKEGLEDYTVLLMALMQVESGGRGTRDIMQSSESAGLGPNAFKTEEQSVRQSVRYLKNVVALAAGYEKNYETNLKLLAQAYNFGSGFLKFVDEKADGIYNVSVAEDYSLTYVAPTLGNTTGEKYRYENEFSKAFGKEYLYRNGGNFYYGNIVSAYLYQDFAPVLMAIEEFQGDDYVFGGKSPINGFDCSGLVSWGLDQVDIALASYTVTQWDNTEAVDPKDARPGDLIFFRGTYGDDPNFISHIEFYINETTMFGSNSSGVGYHSFDDNYWESHFAGIRRIKELTPEQDETLIAQN